MLSIGFDYEPLKFINTPNSDLLIVYLNNDYRAEIDILLYLLL